MQIDMVNGMGIGGRMIKGKFHSPIRGGRALTTFEHNLSLRLHAISMILVSLFIIVSAGQALSILLQCFKFFPHSIWP